MKLYIIPTESKCNARCRFCITPRRKKIGILCKKDYLEIKDVEKALQNPHIEKIEITGGGEPTLNKNLEEIIDLCAKKAKTQMYTNGKLANTISNLEKLYCLCISRAHYDDEKNKKIMGIEYDFKELSKRKIPIKLSLMLHNSGIHTPKEFHNYIDWAKQNKIKKVVVRQMLDIDYKSDINKEFVSCEDVFKNLNLKKYKLVKRNPHCIINNVKVEFEYQETVLHADGHLRRGWSDELI